MDCRQAREMIAGGWGEHWAVQRHLRRCDGCLAFRRRLRETEGLLESALPFAAPVALSDRLLDLVPHAAQELRARAAGQEEARKARRRNWQQPTLYIALALLLGIAFWLDVIPFLMPLVERARSLLPKVQSTLGYWGTILAPLYEALRLAALFLFLALVLEYALRTVRARSTAADRTR